MREIKFRAWDKGNNVMLYNHPDKDKITFYVGGIWIKLVDPYYPNLLYSEPILIENLEIMQYTGLKDKNGKEAYHKDIAGYKDDAGIFQTGILGWNDFAAGFYLCAIDGDDEGNQNGDMDRDFEVIGNVFENPELIEETK